MMGRGVSSVQRSAHAPRATVIRAALKRSMASRPWAIAVAAWSNSLRRLIGGGRCVSKVGTGRPQAACAKAWLTGSGSEKVGCAVNTAAKRVRSVNARYSAQRTGLSSGSGRSRCCASPAKVASLAAVSIPPR